nr:hypothetical protein [Rhodopseudomonas rhenobacensis]
MALIALALQFALAFGHVHAGQFGGEAAAPAQLSVAHAINQPQPTPQPESDDDGCAICAVMAMAQALIAPSPPLLPLPCVAQLRDRVAAAAPAFRSEPHRAFQPRAPPIS